MSHSCLWMLYAFLWLILTVHLMAPSYAHEALVRAAEGAGPIANAILSYLASFAMGNSGRLCGSVSLPLALLTGWLGPSEAQVVQTVRRQ